MLTALVVAFPEAWPIVDGWRERTCLDRPSIGIPPHVTLVFPFVPAEEVGGNIDDWPTTARGSPSPAAGTKPSRC